MDRFIVFAISDRQGVICTLKSNMDRFIDDTEFIEIP